MRILQISPNFPFPPNDGGRIVIYNTYKYVRALGYQIDFICINKKDVDREQILKFDPSNVPEVFIDRAITSVGRIMKNILNGKAVLIYKFFSKDFLDLLIKKIKNNEYDLLHFEGLHSLPYALDLKKRFNKKVVIRFHNIESQIIYRYFKATGNPLLKLFFYLEYRRISNLEKLCYKQIRNVIFISEEDKALALRENIKELNPVVINAGVDLDYFSHLEGNNNKDLLYLGSMDWKPNEDAVIWFINYVFSILIKNYPDLKFYVVGKNPSDKMKSYSSENIIVTGTVEDVRPYIKKTGISIIPLKVGGGMRVKILELMACGKAIVTSHIGAEGISYSNGEDIIIADNAEEMTREISELINNSEKRSSIGKNAKLKATEMYSWFSVLTKYNEYINENLV